MNFPILSAIIFIPLIGALFILVIKGEQKIVEKNSKYVAIFSSLANFFLSIFLWYSFDTSTSDFQFVEKKNWMEDFINFQLGIDGISILFLGAFERGHPPTWLLITTPLTVILIIPISYYLFVENEKILKNFVLKNQFFYNFLLNKWYFDELYNFIFVEPLKKIGLFLWRKGDINTIDRYGPDGLSRLIKIISDKAVNFQSGYLYHYAFVMLIGFSILLTYLILY